MTETSQTKAAQVVASDRGAWTSASSAQADKLCPGRHNAQRGLPEEDTPDADFGQQIHKALEKSDPKGLTAMQESIYDSVLEIEKKLCVAFFGQEVEGKEPNPVCERRFWAIWPDGLRHSGQVDRLHRLGFKALIVDVKSLAGEVVDSPRNLQLRDQAVLFDMSTSALKEVGVAIIQPLVTHSPELCVYTRPDLDQARSEMRQRVVASNDPDAHRVPGPVQCKFCRAKHLCKEYESYASALVPAPKTLVDIPVASWTPDMRKQFCDQYDVAAKWLENCWMAMEAGADKEAGFVPGYHLVEGSPRAKIINLQSVFERASGLGVPLAGFLAKSTITKTDLTELTREFGKVKGKKLSDAVDQIIGEDKQVSQVKKSLKPV
jgi:hypothetical protein